MTRLYYTPPPEECFDDMKQAAISLWSTMGDEPSYSQEKIGRIKDINNIEDNFMYIFAMFDYQNQKKLKLTPDTIREVNRRLIEGGSPEYMLSL